MNFRPTVMVLGFVVYKRAIHAEALNIRRSERLRGVPSVIVKHNWVLIVRHHSPLEEVIGREVLIDVYLAMYVALFDGLGTGITQCICQQSHTSASRPR